MVGGGDVTTIKVKGGDVEKSKKDSKSFYSNVVGGGDVTTIKVIGGGVDNEEKSEKNFKVYHSLDHPESELETVGSKLSDGFSMDCISNNSNSSRTSRISLDNLEDTAVYNEKVLTVLIDPVSELDISQKSQIPLEKSSTESLLVKSPQFAHLNTIGNEVAEVDSEIVDNSEAIPTSNRSLLSQTDKVHERVVENVAVELESIDVRLEGVSEAVTKIETETIDSEPEKDDKTSKTVQSATKNKPRFNKSRLSEKVKKIRKQNQNGSKVTKNTKNESTSPHSEPKSTIGSKNYGKNTEIKPSRIKNTTSLGLDEPNSAQLSWAESLVGGEGNFNINGLAVEKPIAEIKVLKPGLGISRSGINSAFKIAHTGDKFNPSTDHVQSLPKVQLKQSPHGSLEKKSEHSDIRGVSRDELDLIKSNLFTVKLERIDPKVGNQRHLCDDKIKTADSCDPIHSSDMNIMMSQPNLNPNYNPSDTPAERPSLEEETDLLGGPCRGGGW